MRCVVKRYYNTWSIIIGLIIAIIGIISILVDIFNLKTQQNIWISIGCSLIASSIVILFQTFVVDVKEDNPLTKWKLANIYAERDEDKEGFAENLKKIEEHLDIVAFGLRNFLATYSDDFNEIVERGVKVRILVMDPCSKFITSREREENAADGEIKTSIIKLIDIVKSINEKNKNKIKMKGYKCMTLDYYFRMDNEMYVGQYWYKMNGRKTITYKFINKGQGFNFYAKYFEKLWNMDENRDLLETKKCSTGRK